MMKMLANLAIKAGEKELKHQACFIGFYQAEAPKKK